MKKRYLLIALLLVGTGVTLGALYLLKIQAKPIIRSEGLSARAQEYIANQQNQGDELWRRADFDAPEKGDERGVIESTTIDVGDCFTFTVPMYISIQRPEQGDCNYFLWVENPKSEIRIYERDDNASSVDNVGGVQLRRRETHKYTEHEPLTYNGRTYLIFSNESSQTFERIAFNMSESGRLFVLAMRGSSNVETVTEFEQILSSVEFH